MRWWLGLALAALTLAAPGASFGADAVSLAGKWNVLITHSSGGCAWLAGEDSGFTTGADFSCNGGLHMG